MKSFGWSEDYVRKGITGAKGWVFYNWAIENEASIWGDRLERKTDGYVKQEKKKILEQLTKQQHGIIGRITPST